MPHRPPKPLGGNRSSLRSPRALGKVREVIANQSHLQYESMRAGFSARHPTEQ